MTLKAVASTPGGGGGGGVTSLQAETGDITLTSTGGTVTITKPTSTEINLEAAGGSSVAFSAITTGTNTAATMTVGTGGSITVSGSGTNNATALQGNTVATGTPTDGELLIGSSSDGEWHPHTLTAGNNISITNGHGTITINSLVAQAAYSMIG